MKRFLLALAAFVLPVFCLTPLFGQSSFNLPKAYEHIKSKYGLDQVTIGDLKITKSYIDSRTNVEHIYLSQVVNDRVIFGSNISLTMKNGKLYSVGHRLINVKESSYNNPDAKISATDAIKTVATGFGIQSRGVPSFKRMMANGMEVYDKADIALQDIPVELIYIEVSKGNHVLAYKMQFDSPKNGILYQSYVDAATGALIRNDVLTVSCSFETGYLSREEECTEVHAHHAMAPPQAPPVLAAAYRALVPNAESPSHGAFELLTGIEDPTASPFGWHDTDGAAGAEFTHTRGNNVHAFLDRNWDYNPDKDLDGGANLLFDFNYLPDSEPVDNQDLSITNLFVRNNFMHDFTHRYGFDGPSGNFQQNNYGSPGLGDDYVQALAQFGDNNTVQCGQEVNGNTECINNADFSTPIDGFNGRMRMFTWNQDNSAKLLDILQPAELSGKILTGAAQFGIDITTTAVTGPVEVVDDGTSDGSKACTQLEGQDLTGKIMLIDRGLCDFSYKVFNVQEAGAIGAIICNFEDAVIQMGPGDNATEVTIPSVFISKTECDRIRIAAGQGLVASLVAPVQTGAVKRDGSLDNGIISHEYGHGISQRLVGGGGCLGGQEGSGMGEGWSDFFALVTSVHSGDTGEKRRGIGTYAIKESTSGKGIRTYPYTTDMSINPHTYDDIITEAESHGVGSVWTAMLWDLYWDFVDAYGFDDDPIHGNGGNNIAIQLVMDGLKNTPCSPGFIDARDAILLADSLANGGSNSCLIWKAFARRGLGVNADGADPTSWSDGKEGFDLPVSCLDDLRFTKTVTPEIVAGDNIEVTLKIVNHKDFDLTNVTVEDVIPDGTSYVNGSSNFPPIVTNTIVWTIPDISPDEEVTITYSLSTPNEENSIRLEFDDMEVTPEERWDVSYDPAGTFDNFWFPTDVLTHSGSSAWVVGDVDTESEHFLQNFEPYTITGTYPVYRFYHYYNTETGADGGFLEITTNDGQTWNSLAPHIFRNSYPRSLQYATFAIPNLFAYSGVSSPTLEMIPVYIDLSAYIGEDVKIRYRFGTDDNTSGDGWYVDDVEIMDAIIYNAEACLNTNEAEQICAEAPERGTIVDTQITIGTEDENNAYPFTLMPNPAGNFITVAMSAANNENARVNIYNLTGNLVSTATWNITQGVNQKAFDISRFAAGMYVLQVESSTGMRSEKFVKE